MRFLLLLLLSLPAFASDEPLRALVVTCDSRYLPLPGEAFGFKPGFKEVSGIAMGSIADAEKLVKPASYFGGGFVEYHNDLPCFVVKEPRYMGTVWNPDKTKVWCGIYDGIFVKQRECVPVPALK